MWNIRESVPVSLMEICRQNIHMSHTNPLESKTDNLHIQRQSIKKLYKYDLSIALNQTDEFLSALKHRLSQLQGVFILDYAKSNEVKGDNHHCELMFCCFGHAADENLHLNVVATFHVQDHEKNEAIQSMQETLNQLVYDLIIARRGPSHHVVILLNSYRNNIDCYRKHFCRAWHWTAETGSHEALSIGSGTQSHASY